jgi:hypothetical protein
MIRRFLIGLLWAVPGYVVGAFGGGYLVSVMSSNQYDRSLEAQMTGAFFFGPLAALIAFIAGAIRARPPAPEPAADA